MRCKLISLALVCIASSIPSRTLPDKLSSQRHSIFSQEAQATLARFDRIRASSDNVSKEIERLKLQQAVTPR